LYIEKTQMSESVALFVPCYINDFYPAAAQATLEILEDLGMRVHYPRAQRCCGQPFINNGLIDEARSFAEHFEATFEEFDYVVAPSSSCVSTVRHRYGELIGQERASETGRRVYELCEFLHDVVGLERLRFPKAWRGRVGLHNSCHALRELDLALPSERVLPHFSKIRAVLSRVEGLELVETQRDECCGFGGTYSVTEPELSARMGRDRIAEHLANGVDLITGVDRSCLMHMEALARRDGTPVRFVHVAELLAGRVEERQ